VLEKVANLVLLIPGIQVFCVFKKMSLKVGHVVLLWVGLIIKDLGVLAIIVYRKSQWW